ncbi:MAG TPA: aldo/keto reductase [Verrucomicrobiae bacterium]|nr:aldo/keto reductase [Verrucomicrobiae bacterium]
MNSFSRRNFLTTLAGAAGAAPWLLNAASQDDIPPPPQVTLGKTGITCSRLAQGTGMKGGNRQSNHTRMGFEALVNLFRHGYERGVTFFDLADMYGSHPYFREALRHIPRDKIAILTKLWWRFDGKPDETPDDYKRRSCQMALERFLTEIATDRLDFVLLHCVTVENWDQELAPYMETLAKAKEKGTVRALGVSCHSLIALKKAAEHPWVDAVLARINPKGAKMDGTVEEVVPVLRRIKENGKTLLGMKIYGEGTLAHMKDECMKYAQGLGLIDAMTVGAESPAEIDESLRLMAKYPAAPII